MRVPLRSSGDTVGDTQRVLAKLEQGGVDLAITRAVANSTSGLRPFALMGDALIRKSSLPPRIRELVVLALAAETGSGYERAEHEPIAKRCGVSAEECSQLAGGFDAILGPEDGGAASIGSLEEEERLALRIASALLRRRELSGKDWRRAEEAWGREGAVDLVLAVAWWGSYVPTVISALELEEGDA